MQSCSVFRSRTADLASDVLCTLSKGSILHAVCGGTPLSPVTCDPCGRTAQPSDGEGDACHHSPPDKSPVTLRHGCEGTDDSILHAGCGGTPPDQMTCDPCGRTASASDSCSHSPLEPQIVHLGRHDPVDPPTPVSYGALLPPLSPSQPFTASIPVSGHGSAMLLSSDPPQG